MSITKEQIEQVDEIFSEAKLRIIAVQFLSDFKDGKLTLDEAVELVMQMAGKQQLKA